MRTSIFALGLSLLIASPVLAAASAEKDVLSAMEAWRQAMLKKDRAALDKAFHTDLTYGHSSGVVEDKAQAIEHVVAGAGTYLAINLTDTKVRVQGNTALVTGKAEYQERTNGKDAIANLVVLSVWLKSPKGWQMIARQATKPAAPAVAAPTPPPPAH
jgi:ketosteroid isomerase-like protein